MLNKTISIVFTLNCNAWKLKKFTALSAITDFHHAFCEELAYMPIAIKSAYMRAMWLPAAIKLKKKNKN